MLHPVWFVRDTFLIDSYYGYSAFLDFVVMCFLGTVIVLTSVSLINHIGCNAMSQTTAALPAGKDHFTEK